MKLLFIFSALAFLSACSIKGSIEDLTEATKALASGTQTGLSSGATAVEKVNGYTVSTSVGNYTDGIHEVKNGYHVYLSLQGSATSEVAQ